MVSTSLTVMIYLQVAWHETGWRKRVLCAGPSMMPGGSKDGYEAIRAIVEKVAAQVDDGPCVTYIGPGGSGALILSTCIVLSSQMALQSMTA